MWCAGQGGVDGSPAPAISVDRLVTDLAQVFGTGHAQLSVVTPDRGWLTAASPDRAAGPVHGQTRCAQVADTRQMLVVADLTSFFAGAPVRSREGAVIGVLCVWDDRPHSPAAAELQALSRFAEHAAALLELRRSEQAHQHDHVVLATTGSVLEMIVNGAELDSVLDTIARSIEEVNPTGLCSIMLLDGDVLYDAAAPSLPAGYRAAIRGQAIGPSAGSCGTAIFTGLPVIVSDIAVDERWRDYADLAIGHGLRACWSVPITEPDGTVVGAFAIYHREVRHPQQHELDQLARWVNLAEVAIGRARSIAALRAAAHRDPLTGLVNRPQLLRELETRLRGPAADDVAVLFIDLDRFKAINDTLGHHVGDHFLQVVATRLSSRAGPDDVVARFGGDEFVVLTSAPDPGTVEQLGRAMLDVLGPPMTALGQTVRVTASIGLVTAGSAPGAASATTLVGDADLAMYDAKAQGRAGVTWFAPVMRERAQDRLQIQIDLDRAIDNGELYCVYQPKVEVRSAAVVGVEALLRWQSPTRGLVSPLVFIPLAEECGLIGRVGQLVLRQACAQLAAWRAADPAWRHRDVWVNVSVHQLADPGFSSLVHQTLADTGLAATGLGLEITESSFMDDAHLARGVLHDLRALGIGIAIDDFGIGFSSMSRLKRFPVDVLKIDREFVTDIAEDPIDAQIVAGLLALAGSLGLQVVAEGVETQAQRDRLLELGCGWAQGFFWSPPLPANELAALVTAGEVRAEQVSR